MKVYNYRLLRYSIYYNGVCAKHNYCDSTDIGLEFNLVSSLLVPCGSCGCTRIGHFSTYSQWQVQTKALNARFRALSKQERNTKEPSIITVNEKPSVHYAHCLY